MHRRGSARGARLPNRAVGPGRTDAEATQTDPLEFKCKAAVVGDRAHGLPSGRNCPGWGGGNGLDLGLLQPPGTFPAHKQVGNP